MEDLFTEFVHQLIKTEIDLCFYLIIQKLSLEMVQSISSTVTVQVQWVQDILHHVGLLVLQDMVGEDPRQRHLNGELNTLTHGELQIELPKPQLGQVTTLTQRTYT